MSADPQAPENSSRIRPADAVRAGFIDRAARLSPYLRLMRLDRPIGAWLLFWPCVFGLELGTAALGFGWPRASYVLLCALGSILMRGAGCTYNDIVDRHIDARVARSRGRPIPSGAVTVKQAWIFCAIQLVLALAVLLAICLIRPVPVEGAAGANYPAFNRFAALIAVGSLFFVAVYPFMKRVTWWPQAWLGLTFNWGVLFGFAAVTARPGTAPALFYAGCFFWTIGYDTLYAFTDIQDDLLIGVKSSAIRLGKNAYKWLYAFYSAAIGLMLAGGIAAGMGIIFIVAMALPALHLYWQMRKLSIDDPALCLRLFRANRDTGALIALALLIGAITQL